MWCRCGCRDPYVRQIGMSISHVLPCQFGTSPRPVVVCCWSGVLCCFLVFAMERQTLITLYERNLARLVFRSWRILTLRCVHARVVHWRNSIARWRALAARWYAWEAHRLASGVRALLAQWLEITRCEWRGVPLYRSNPPLVLTAVTGNSVHCSNIGLAWR